MPRVRANGAAPDWQRLQMKAAAQGGYFSTREAVTYGIGRQLLQHHLATGRLRRIGRGAFQLSHFSPAVHDGCVEAWLWSGGAGLLSHETALRLHGLIDAWPVQVHLTVPESWQRNRLRPPEGVVLHFQDVPEALRAGGVPIPFTNLEGALAETALWSSEPALVEAAFAHVLERGLLDWMTLELCLRPNHPLREVLDLPLGGLARSRSRDASARESGEDAAGRGRSLA